MNVQLPVEVHTRVVASTFIPTGIEGNALFSCYLHGRLIAPTPAPTPVPTPDWAVVYGQQQKCYKSSVKITGEQGVPLDACRERCGCDDTCVYFHWKLNIHGGWCSTYSTCNLVSNTEWTAYKKVSNSLCPTPSPTPAPTPMPTPDWDDVYGQGQRCDKSSAKISGEQGVALDACRERCRCDDMCLYYHWKLNGAGGWCST